MNSSPFGGSEELWTRTARLLVKQGVRVAASVHGSPQLDQRISSLRQAGVDLRPRSARPSLFARARRRWSGKTQIVFDIVKSFSNIMPDLVVISNGGPLPPIEVAEMCVARQWPFVILAHSFDPLWPSDELAARYRHVLPLARRYFFVSEANRALTERQLGYHFENVEIVRNPVTSEIDAPLPWPVINVQDELRLACVGTLFPTHKGQDIVLDVLAQPSWQARKWKLTFYGDGPNRDSLHRLVKGLELSDRVSFAGHAKVEKIWTENHVLIMPSRKEGMPITIVEAMLCGRPVVATNVGGIPEIVKDSRNGFLAEAPVVESFAKALENMWVHRDRLQEMGQLAAKSIGNFVSDDPVGEFADKLKRLAGFQFANSIGKLRGKSDARRADRQG